ncbi:MAG: ArnT family glycosyltransferase [Actinomycetota bacterium]
MARNAESRAVDVVTPDLSGFFLSLALLVRIGAFIMINFVVFTGELEHPDSLYYHERATELIRGEGSAGVAEYLANKGGYVVFVAGAYQLLGQHPFVLALVNVLCGAGTVVLGYRLARHVFDIDTARIAGFMLALDPALVYWSTQLLKDTLVTFLAFAAVYLVLGKRRLQLQGGVELTVVILVLASLRPEVAFASVIALSFFGLRSRGRPGAALILALVGVGVFAFTTASSWWEAYGGRGVESGESVVQFVENVRVGSDVESHVAFYQGTLSGGEFGSTTDLLATVAKSPLYFLFVPYIWQARSTWELLYVVPGLWWYLVGILGTYGIVKAFGNRRARNLSWLVLLLGLPIVILFTAPAAIVRWRLPSAALLVPFAAYGVRALRFRDRRRAEARVV